MLQERKLILNGVNLDCSCCDNFSYDCLPLFELRLPAAVAIFRRVHGLVLGSKKLCGCRHSV